VIMKKLFVTVAASVAAIALAGWAGTAQADNGGRTGSDSSAAAATSSGDPASTSSEPGHDTTTGLRCIQASPIVLTSTTASATFTIAAGCADMPVTLGVYLTHGAGFSMPQTLSHMTGGVFGAGSSHTLTVSLPGCFVQVDLMGVATPPSKLMTSADLAAQQTVEWAFAGSATACSTSTGGGSEEKPPVTTGGGSTGGTTEGGGTPPVTPPVSVTAPPAAPVTTPPAVAPPATTPPATTPPATVPPAKHKVVATGGVAGARKTFKAAPHVAAAKVGGTLPFTGMPIWIVALVGLGLMTVGGGVFRATRSTV